ncbi:MAG: DUF167 domain-containing protein [Candidatus Omnitrophica bacterium]|nr:DUF167 domain-containing protein [Candidatus Omnitrophota bacterium]
MQKENLLRINIRVIPGASRDKIVKENGRLKVYVCAPAESGRANKAVIDLLADHFDKRKSGIEIVKGGHSRDKVVQID